MQELPGEGHLVCYNSCSAFGRIEPLPPLYSNHSHELYINQYSSEHPAVAKKRECYSDNLLVCFRRGSGIARALPLSLAVYLVAAVWAASKVVAAVVVVGIAAACA